MHRLLWDGDMTIGRLDGLNRNNFANKRGRGLGIKDLKLFNMTLLGKWKRRLDDEHSSMWKMILDSKYDSWRGLDDINVSRLGKGIKFISSQIYLCPLNASHLYATRKDDFVLDSI